MNETQTQGTSASAGSTPSVDQSANAGPNNSQPTNAPSVDTGRVEANGNSESSDGTDGSNSESNGRQRPNRAERRISELTTQIRQLEAEKLQNSNVVSQLLQTPPQAGNLPDYNGVDEVYPSQIAKDVYEAVSKSIDAKLTGTANVLQNQVLFSNAVQRNIVEAEKARNDFPVLNENNPDSFDPDLTKEIDNGFLEIFNKDPNYSYAKHISIYKSVLGKPNTSSKGTDTTTSTSGQALRQGASSNRKTEFNKNMSLTEMQDWFKGRRG